MSERCGGRGTRNQHVNKHWFPPPHPTNDDDSTIVWLICASCFSFYLSIFHAYGFVIVTDAMLQNTFQWLKFTVEFYPKGPPKSYFTVRKGVKRTYSYLDLLDQLTCTRSHIRIWWHPPLSDSTRNFHSLLWWYC